MGYQRTGLALSMRLASLGIIGAQLRASLKPPVHHSTIVLSGLRGSINFTRIMLREVSLSGRQSEISQSESLRFVRGIFATTSTHSWKFLATVNWPVFLLKYLWTGKTALIRRIAVRETSVSRHHGGQLLVLLKLPYITALSYLGF